MTDSDTSHSTTRRKILLAAGVGAVTFGTGLARAAVPTRGKPVPLPTEEVIRRDYQHMVDFGARLPGHPDHIRFVDYLAHEFQQIGLTLGPCDSYAYKRWDPLRYGLEIANGSAKVAPPVAYYVRSQPTSYEGVSGELFYGGEITAGGPIDLGDIPKGSIVVFDAKLPQTTIKGLADPHYIHVPDAEKEAYLAHPYKRVWQMPAFPLEAVLAKGAAGVVILIDVPSEMLSGNFSPHASHYKPPLPALFAGEESGSEIRRLAKIGAKANLTLFAKWVDCAVPSLTAILPSDDDPKAEGEVIVIDTHTDGQNYIEENGGMTMLQLARHFAGLPRSQRLRRTVVFVGWPGHMSGGLPECTGWVRAHPDLVKRAAAAVTIEHLGAPEWEDIPGTGYGPTGRNEYMNFATTAGVLTDFVRQGFVKFDLRQHGIQRAPGTTTGAVFHNNGVPHVGIICGPNYLLGIVPNSHMDKLDAGLAARQTAMIAELVKRIDQVPAAELRAGDVSLGAHPTTGPDTSVRGPCLPTGAAR